MKYIAVLGRQPEISIAELEALFCDVKQISNHLASFTWTGDTTWGPPIELDENGGKVAAGPVQSIDKLGGILKLAAELNQKPLDYLRNLPDGKITIGISDYTKNATVKTAREEALKLKKILVRQGRSVRVVENREAVLSTATSLHNGLSGKNARKIELVKTDQGWYKVIGIQDIDAYAKRDQARPARDAKVGMLPPKLAQIFINLCGPLKPGSVVLDPFCGTGVVLQEALLMGYHAYGTDINERMIEYSKKNINWLLANSKGIFSGSGPSRPSSRGSGPNSRQQPPKYPENSLFELAQGDATSFQWSQPIDAVACESYLGKPFTKIPTDLELKEQKQECQAIILGFLKNLAGQIKSKTPVTIAIPAWLRENGSYSRLEILDEIEKLGYNVNNKSREGLLYSREGQIVARDILILRKK